MKIQRTGGTEYRLGAQVPAVLHGPYMSWAKGNMMGVVQGASIGQVWTRHLAPAAPASQPSSPSQFHDCACHADSALPFCPFPPP